jgi:hypothetical protein
MRQVSHRRWGLASLLALGVGLGGLCVPSDAWAHVKWFAPFNVASAPRPLGDALSVSFWAFNGLAASVFWVACLLERTPVGATLVQTLDRVSLELSARSDEILRACGAVFFVALWVMGTAILTPELKTVSPGIHWFQLAIAAGLFWRRTMVLSGLGIVVLYGIAVAGYGVFHLMDYPIFLGLAVYYMASGLELKPFGWRPLDIVRWGAGITLCWASVEKWAYPQWTYPVLQQHPRLAMGWDANVYMTAAGVIEFGLALGLLWTPMIRRLSAILLGAMFISAIFEFGKIDAIGHLMIIAILLAVALDGDKSLLKRHYLAPIAYGAALAATVGAYYGLHAVFFGNS